MTPRDEVSVIVSDNEGEEAFEEESKVEALNASPQLMAFDMGDEYEEDPDSLIVSENSN